MALVFIEMGSNLKNRKKNLELFLKELKQNPKIEILNFSSIYETEPYGSKEQPFFLNQVIKINTTLSPVELLELLKETEKKLGRKETSRWGPRLIDLDILLYDDLVLNTEKLTIPHKEMHQRRFALVPLAEIAPNLVHPVLKKGIKNILEKLKDKSEVKIYAGD